MCNPGLCARFERPRGPGRPNGNSDQMWRRVPWHRKQHKTGECNRSRRCTSRSASARQRWGRWSALPRERSFSRPMRKATLMSPSPTRGAKRPTWMSPAQAMARKASPAPGALKWKPPRGWHKNRFWRWLWRETARLSTRACCWMPTGPAMVMPARVQCCAASRPTCRSWK